MDNQIEMLEKARKVMAHAYSPYSHFLVGCCIRTDKNNYYVGCNYENASYSLTSCAEATAIGNMIANGESKIIEVVVIGSSESPCTPCGACRQRIREFSSNGTLIHSFGKNSQKITMTLDELLPLSFGPEMLKENR